MLSSHIFSTLNHVDGQSRGYVASSSEPLAGCRMPKRDSLKPDPEFADIFRGGSAKDSIVILDSSHVHELF